MTRLFLLFCGIFALAFALPSDSTPGFEKLGEYRYAHGNGTRANIYFASTSPADQDDAMIACRRFLNGQLATVLSRAEFDTIANGLPPSGIDYTTYFTAGRKVGGNWFWLTNGELIDRSLLFWGEGGIYPIGMEGGVLAIRTYGNSVPSTYSDSWGFSARKKYVCQVTSEF